MEKTNTKFRYQTIEEYQDAVNDSKNEIAKIENQIEETVQLLEDSELSTMQIKKEVRNFKIKGILYTFLEIILAITTMISLSGSINLFVFIPALFGVCIIPIMSIQDGLSLYEKINTGEYNLETNRLKLNLEDAKKLVLRHRLMITKLKELIMEMNSFAETSNLESDNYREVKASFIPNYNDDALEVSKEENAKQLVLRKKNNE